MAVTDLPAPRGVAPALLEGVRVLDLSTSIAAPYAGMLLGDFGANVVKVERLRGDDCRAWGPPFLDGESLWFIATNRNKRGITLDYATDAGRHALYALVAEADVLIVNLTPRVQKKLGIDAQALQAVKPDLIHVSLTGFGLTGARADWPAYDLIAEGYSGVMDLTGELETPPQKVGAPAADLLAGMDAALAVLAALHDRQRTGKGHVIDIAMVESMARFLSQRIVPYLGGGPVPRRSGGRDSVIAIYQAFETQDLPITLGLGNDGIWARFWQAVGDPAVGEDPRFATNAMRHANRPEIVAKIQTLLMSAPRDHWLRLFEEKSIPAGPINRVDEVVADEELLERGLFYSIEKGDRRIPQVGLGIQFDGEPSAPRLAPPLLGEHNDEVFAEWAKLSSEQVAHLRESKVIS